MNRLNNIDRALILCSALLALLSSFLIINDYLLISGFDLGSQEQVGQVFKQENDIRVRQKSSVVWNPSWNNKRFTIAVI